MIVKNIQFFWKMSIFDKISTFCHNIHFSRKFVVSTRNIKWLSKISNFARKYPLSSKMSTFWEKYPVFVKNNNIFRSQHGLQTPVDDWRRKIKWLGYQRIDQKMTMTKTQTKMPMKKVIFHQNQPILPCKLPRNHSNSLKIISYLFWYRWIYLWFLKYYKYDLCRSEKIKICVRTLNVPRLEESF